MATPLTADKLLAALKAEGVHVAEHPGWRTHERDAATGKPFGPVHGVLIHHTAGRDSLATVYGGRPGLPGPLAHSHLAKSGLCTMCSDGRANHAGLAAVNAYNAILNESAVHPKPSAASGTVDGNDVLYGIEIENLGNGHDPYPAVQYDAAVRWAAALCRAHGWGANSVAGHKETSVEGKIDPSFDMNAFRAKVAERLKHPASWNPGSTPTTTPPVTSPAKETDMQLNDQVPIGDWLPQTWPDDKGLADKKISVGTALGSTYGHSRAAHEGVDALRTEVADLRAAIAKLTSALTKEA